MSHEDGVQVLRSPELPGVELWRWFAVGTELSIGGYIRPSDSLSWPVTQDTKLYVPRMQRIATSESPTTSAGRAGARRRSAAGWENGHDSPRALKIVATADVNDCAQRIASVIFWQLLRPLLLRLHCQVSRHHTNQWLAVTWPRERTGVSRASSAAQRFAGHSQYGNP
jgi:hypothetical protein